MKPYQLICSYVRNRYFVSTAYRKSSATVEIWYFETIAWEWDSESKSRGKMLLMEDSGSHSDLALDNHAKICHQFIHQKP